MKKTPMPHTSSCFVMETEPLRRVKSWHLTIFYVTSDTMSWYFMSWLDLLKQPLWYNKSPLVETINWGPLVYTLYASKTALLLYVILNGWLYLFIVCFWLLHGWYHVKMLSVSAHVPYTPYNHASVNTYSVSWIQATYVGCMCVCCNCNLTPALLAQWLGSFSFTFSSFYFSHATVVTQGWKGYQDESQHRKLTMEKKILLGLKPQSLC